MNKRYQHLLIGGLLLITSELASAAPLLIACATNFRATLDALIADYKVNHPEAEFRVSSGASGQLFQQLVMGSQHQLFLSADRHYPEQLEQQGLTVPNSRITYAIGELAIWHPHHAIASPADLLQLNERIAIANPRLAPYGEAASAALSALAPDKSWLFVYGNSVGQTHQLVRSGNVRVGVLAYSHLLNEPKNSVTRWPMDAYPPIEQQLVLMASASKQPLAQGFVNYLTAEAGQYIIRQYGYQVRHDAP